MIFKIRVEKPGGQPKELRSPPLENHCPRSTGGLRPSCGPRSSFGGQPVFFIAKNDNFIHKYQKNDQKSALLATKA
jgi:hypothetical protein